MPVMRLTLTLEAARLARDAMEFKLRVVGEHTKEGRLCKDLLDRLDRGVLTMETEAQPPFVGGVAGD